MFTKLQLGSLRDHPLLILFVTAPLQVLRTLNNSSSNHRCSLSGIFSLNVSSRIKEKKDARVKILIKSVTAKKIRRINEVMHRIKKHYIIKMYRDKYLGPPLKWLLKMKKWETYKQCCSLYILHMLKKFTLMNTECR